MAVLAAASSLERRVVAQVLVAGRGGTNPAGGEGMSRVGGGPTTLGAGGGMATTGTAPATPCRATLTTGTAPEVVEAACVAGSGAVAEAVLTEETVGVAETWGCRRGYVLVRRPQGTAS